MATDSTKNARPNILLICVDQMRADAALSPRPPGGSYPYLDQLVQRGTVFTNAYSAIPTRVPARVGLFTGQSAERARPLSFHRPTRPTILPSG